MIHVHNTSRYDDSDIFEGRRNGRKLLASNDSNTNVTDKAKSLQQVTDRWNALVGLGAFWTHHTILFP